MLREEFLKPLKMTATDLARGIKSPHDRVTKILHGERGVTADTAVRLGRFLRTSARFWLNLQADYDLALAEAQNPHTDIEPWRSPFTLTD